MVPTLPLMVSPGGISTANPKSDILTWPRSSNKIFSGLRSLRKHEHQIKKYSGFIVFHLNNYITFYSFILAITNHSWSLVRRFMHREESTAESFIANHSSLESNIAVRLTCTRCFPSEGAGVRMLFPLHRILLYFRRSPTRPCGVCGTSSLLRSSGSTPDKEHPWFQKRRPD